MIKKFKFKLWQKVLIGMVLGIFTGLSFGSEIGFLEYLGIFFLNMIKMVAIPLVFFTIIYGTTSVEHHSGMSRISAKAILIFFCTAIVAACIGLVTTSIIKPGEGENKVQIVKMMSDAENTSTQPTMIDENKSFIDFLVNIVPSNFFDAAAKGNILQVIVFGFFCGIILNKNSSKCEELIKLTHQTAQMLFSMIEAIMKFAPIGVFGYIASLVAVDGIGIILTMSKLIMTIALGCIVQYFFFGLIILVLGSTSPMPFYRKIFDIQLLAFSTSSSKAVLVPMMNKCEKELGISKEGSRFILPLSAALNMDGGAIYQVSCAIFFSQIYGLSLGFHEYIIIILMSTVASIGGAGIPSGALLFLGMVLHSVGMSMDGVLIVATIDRILDMFTTVINVTGDIFATLMVEISEKRLNKKIYNSR